MDANERAARLVRDVTHENRTLAGPQEQWTSYSIAIGDVRLPAAWIGPTYRDEARDGIRAAIAAEIAAAVAEEREACAKLEAKLAEARALHDQHCAVAICNADMNWDSGRGPYEDPEADAGKAGGR